VEGLPRQGAYPPQDDDARARGIHASVSPARPTVGFYRIRHYGLPANAGRRENLAKARTLLDAPQPPPVSDEATVTPAPTFVCRCCGAAMRVVEIVMRQQPIRAPP
jgi:hypothetical protein